MSTKQRVLELFEKNRGSFISGEGVAKLLEVSRNAVWKSIQELRREGYAITAVTNKGYCLASDSDIISAEGISPFLSGSIAAENIHIYKSLESTNKTAKEKAISGAEHGTIIIADHQVSGRGRYNRSFFSPSGHGIYMSLILRPEQLSLSDPTAITALAAVCVCQAIEAVTEKTPQIKWVNDILLGGKKVCGILTEAVTDFESQSLQWIVLGIGINHSTPHTAIPAELQDIAASLYPNGQPLTTRNRLIAEIINRLIFSEKPVQEQGVFAEYKKRLMTIGRKITVLEGQSQYDAEALDIDSKGHLIIQKTDGNLHTLFSGEVSIRQ